MLTAANTAGDKHKQHYHYLKGSVFCGVCGERLIISLSKNRHGTVYPYFICVGRQKKRSPCTMKAVLIDHVEALTEEHYLTVQPTKELAVQIKTVLLAEIVTRRTEFEQERAVQSQRLHRLTDERRRLLEAYYENAVHQSGPIKLAATPYRGICSRPSRRASLPRWRARRVVSML